MLSLRTLKRLCAALDTVALTAVAAAISKSLSSTQRRDLSTTRTIPEAPALARLKKERDPERLFHLFRSNATNRLLVENRFAFEDTVARLAGAGRPDLVEELLEHQKALPQGRREGFVVRLITLYGKAGLADRAGQTFDEMPLYGCPRTAKSLNATLRVLAADRRYDDFRALFGRARGEYGIRPDDISYNLVVKLLCDVGSLEGAYLAMLEMEKDGVRPDVVTYTTLMATSYKNNRREIGDGLWNLMVLKGCSPNLATFNARVQFLINKRKVWQAKRLLEKMVFMGVVPDEVTYNLLIKGFCMLGDVEMAKRVFYGMPKRGCMPNGKIFQTMVHYLCKVGDFSLAFTLCKDSMRRNWFPSVDSIGRLLEGLGTVSNERGAEEIMEMVRERVPPYSAEQIRNLQFKLQRCCLDGVMEIAT